MKQIVAIEKFFAIQYMDKIESAKAEDRKAALDLFGNVVKGENILTIDGDSAHIEIVGPMSQDGPSPIAVYFGFKGTSYLKIREAIEEVKANQNIKNVYLEMDTPGGYVKGVDEVWQAVKELSSQKHVVAVNNGLIASGGYYIASAANKIISRSPMNETGSVGVLIIGTDWSKWEEEHGIKTITIKSKNAKNKAPDIGDKEGRDILQENVDAIERVFIDRISSGRGISSEAVIKKFGNGKTFIAKDPDGDIEDALSIGMIDSIEKLEDTEKKNRGGSFSDDNSDSSASSSKDKSEKNKGKFVEVGTMNFDKLIAETQGLGEYIKSLEKEAHKKGLEEANDANNKRIEAASKYLGNKDYPESISNMAKDVLIGKTEFSILTGTVGAYDAITEKEKSEAAAAESSDAGDTPPAEPETGSENGVINTEEDYQKTIAEDRKKTNGGA